MNNSDLYITGKKYEDNDRPDMAYPYYLEAILSEKDGEACYALAKMYYYGEYVSQNYDKAGMYVGMAYDLGIIHKIWPLIVAGSVYDYKYIHEADKDVENLNMAIEYYIFAAKNGISYGYACLGYLYLQIGEYEKALKNMKKAKKNNTLAYYAMARAYDEGLGVEQDINKAVKLYKKTIDFWKKYVEDHGTDRYASDAENRLQELQIMSTRTGQ